MDSKKTSQCAVFLLQADGSSLDRVTSLASEMCGSKAKVYTGSGEFVAKDSQIRLTISHAHHGQGLGDLANMNGNPVMLGVIVMNASAAAHQPVEVPKSVTPRGNDFTVKLPDSATDDAQVDASELGKLTVAEQKVLRMLAEGLSTKQIATQLFVSPRTIETHRSQISRKLDIRSVAGLTRFAIRAGLTEL